MYVNVCKIMHIKENGTLRKVFWVCFGLFFVNPFIILLHVSNYIQYIFPFNNLVYRYVSISWSC